MTISAIDPDFPHRHVLKTEDGPSVIVTNEPDCEIVGLIMRDSSHAWESRLYITHSELAELHDMIGRAIAAADKAREKYDAPENV